MRDFSYLVWAERVLLLLSFAYLCLHSLPRAWATLNTDFPNYYLAAKLARLGIDTSRMYEWTWIQRQKDILGMGGRVIGLLPITPFSTLFFLPLTYFGDLTAKHVWIVLNLVLLVPITWTLRSLTGMSVRRIAVILLLSYPLYRNLLYGQFYIVLLFMLLAACLSYVRGHRSMAAVLIAIAGMCKVFPLLLFIVFLRRREWKPLASGIVAITCCAGLSIMVFGLEAHRVWIAEIFPWVMRGEGLGTYSVAASFSGILHSLLLNEPQWNPQPWLSWPLGFAVLTPLLTMFTLAPAVLLFHREDQNTTDVLLEWSSLLTAALAVSTIPASYNFVLMVFPVCVLLSILMERRHYAWCILLMVAYLGIGYPLPVPEHVQGLRLLLYVPRLPLMLAVLFGLYTLQWQARPSWQPARDWIRIALAGAMVASLFLNMRTKYLQERGERSEYAYRLPLAVQGYANTMPQAQDDRIRFVRFGLSGYQLVTAPGQGGEADDSEDGAYDLLSFASADQNLLAERVSVSPSSGINAPAIVDLSRNSNMVVDHAYSPILSPNGRDLAFLRDDHGRARLMLRRDFRSASTEIALTPKEWNVYEASLGHEGKYAVAASDNHGRPRIFQGTTTHKPIPVTEAGSRYPALSPDGRWMAYSHLEHGFWNLWLRDEGTGVTKRIADVPCNQMQPSWQSDSKTVLYTTDCGRSIWFGAIARRQIIP